MRIREVLNKHRQIQTNLTLKVRSGTVTSVDSLNLSEYWNICRRAVDDGFPFMSIIHCCEGGIFWYVHKNAVEIGLKLFCAADGSTGAVFLQWYVVRWETDRNLLIHTSSPVKNVQIHVSTLLKDCVKKKTLSSNVLFRTNTLKTKAILAFELFHIRRWRRNRSKACRPWNLIYMDSSPNPSKRWRCKACNIEKCKLQNLKLSPAPAPWQHLAKCQSRDRTW